MTNPGSEVFRKGGQKMCFTHGVYTACGKHNFALGVEVRTGNVHDSVIFNPLYAQVANAKKFIKMFQDSKIRVSYSIIRLVTNNGGRDK